MSKTQELPYFEYWTTNTANHGVQYYWHFKAKNGHLIATGGEGFSSLQSMTNSVNNFIALVKQVDKTIYKR